MLTDAKKFNMLHSDNLLRRSRNGDNRIDQMGLVNNLSHVYYFSISSPCMTFILSTLHKIQ